ncbi:MAG: hypothetical protein AAGD96_01185 [Chloroflexota bacterium]
MATFRTIDYIRVSVVLSRWIYPVGDLSQVASQFLNILLHQPADAHKNGHYKDIHAKGARGW